jgi:hypothetical protein
MPALTWDPATYPLKSCEVTISGPLLEAGDHVLHGPTGEEWLLLGISRDGRTVAVAGWPPTQALASDCTLQSREGTGWLDSSPGWRDRRQEAFGDDFVDRVVPTQETDTPSGAEQSCPS